MKITKEKVKSCLSFLMAILIALLIRTVVFEPYSIPSGSMKPNFLIGDYLFVSKYQYGISNASLPLEPNLFKGRIFAMRKPERGDVIVFKSPHNRWTNYIKRLIGLPGDKIQIKEGILYINGQMALRKEVGKFTDPDSNEILTKYIETLPNGVSYYVIEDDKGSIADNTEVFQVPAGHYFMVGDNRNHSIDSRFGEHPIGFVPYKKLIGRAEMIFFSNSESLFHFWKWPFTFQKRFFVKVKPL